MSFLRPANLIPLYLHYIGAVDNLTDVVLGFLQVDAKIFYIDIIVEDADNTFDTTTLTIEYDDGASGVDTVIFTGASGAGSGSKVILNKTLDDLTTSLVPGGSRLLLTAANVSTGADTGLKITIWYQPTSI